MAVTATASSGIDRRSKGFDVDTDADDDTDADADTEADADTDADADADTVVVRSTRRFRSLD